MGFHHGRHHVGAAFQTPVGLTEHGVGLAHTRSGTKVDAQFPTLGMAVGPTFVSHQASTVLTRKTAVEVEIEQQDIDGRLTEDSEGSAAAILRHDCAYLARADMPCPGHPGDLDVGVGR